MTDNTSQDRDADEPRLAGLIRQGGAREQPSAAMHAAVRTAAHREWRDVVAARTRRRNTRWSLAAAAAAAGLAVWLTLPMLQAPAAVVAAVTRVSGPVEIGAVGLFGRFAPVQAGADVTATAQIRSGSGGRVALQVGGTSLRLDENSVLAMVAPDRVALKRGAVYVDSGADGTAQSSLLIETPYGTVEHVGTQYETRLADGVLRVRVREGLVRLNDARQAIEATAGEQVTLLSSGEVRRGAVGRAGGEWAWAGEIAPPFDIENRSLAEFLRWAARETGRDVAFASAASEGEAASVTLRGSVAGLNPERALAAVLSTTQLGYRETGDQLLIDFRTGDR
jgi:ferric-dicitrate binding protein FerR (iron transport regulator)